MDQEAVEVLQRRNPEISIDRECVEDLSSRQRGQKKNSKDQPTVENLSRAKQRDSIEKGCVELEENRFFERKNT